MSTFIFSRFVSWFSLYRKGWLLPVIVVATIASTLYATAQSRVAVPPRARIVYSMESASNRGRYQLYLDAWPEESKRVIQPKAMGQYRTGDDVRSPVFSPGGKSILFTGNRSSGSGKQTNATDDTVGLDLWVLDIGKNSVKPITTDGAGYLYARWSPDSRYVCAVSLEGYYSEHTIGSRPSNLYVWEVCTGKRRLLAKTASSPTWSIDSRRVCYEGVAGDEIPVFLSVDVNGGKPKILLRPKSTAYLTGWSPDGKFLAYSEYDAAQDGYNVSVLRCGQQNARRFLKLPLGAVGMKWSPDSQRIALVKNVPHQPSGEYKSMLLVLDIRSGRTRELWSALGEVTILGWSKHGDWIIATRYRTLAPTYQQELVAASAQGNKVVVLRAPAQPVRGFDWQELSRSHDLPPFFGPVKE